MPRNPKAVSDRPATLDVEDPRGDVLSDVLGAARLKLTLYNRMECRAPWGLAVVSHDRAAFYLVARGTALLEIEGAEPVVLSAGDVAFLPNGTPHTLRDSVKTKPQTVCEGHRRGSTSPCKFGGDGALTVITSGFFELGVGRQTVLFETLPPIITLSAADGAAGPWVAATVQLLVAESAAPGPASTLVLQRLADVLFIQALRSVASHQRCRRKGIAALQDPQVGEALSLLHGKVDEPWTVASLATKVGLSRSGLAARFTELVGEPPLQYLARWRMARAAELLQSTDESLVEIAAKVGYESLPSFSKAYKRWQGVSPAASRKRQREDSATVPTSGR